MYFKAKLLSNIDEDLLSSINLNYNSQIGKEIIEYKNHEFEIDRDSENKIVELTFCSQCVNTYDIETVFVSLLIKLLNSNEMVILIDSDGSEEEMSREDLFEIIE